MKQGKSRTVLFLLARSVWVGLNAGCFLTAGWYSTLPPVEGTHPGFLLLPIWLLLLFPGNIAMLGAFGFLSAVAPDWVLSRFGTALFFSIWAGGAFLTYRFWFVWVPLWTSSRRQRAGQPDRGSGMVS